MLRRLYATILEKNLKVLPKHIMIVANEDLINNFEKFLEFMEWCRKFDVNEITICFPDNNVDYSRFDCLRDFKIRVIKKGGVSESLKGESGRDSDKHKLNLILGYKGREEIVDAVKKLAMLVEAGKLKPEEVDEETIEKYLVVKSPPDLIIKAGEEIPEFLTWQSIYSELYFIDLDWKSFRYIYFLRCLRDYQRRERRYGR